MAGRASIVGAAATHVGKVREHNEDAHFLDPEAGLFLVCDGMGGHAAGEVASALAIERIRVEWLTEATQKIAEAWLARGTADAKQQLIGALRRGVLAAHDEIVSEGAQDDAKSGMGTTLVAAIVVGNELVFAHAGDSRAYLVRDGIAMQLTEDHTLLARLLAAGIDVDVSGEGARFRSMLTNALGIGQECKVATFVVPLADGDRFLLCSDGISEYVPEAEVGTVLSKAPSPARAAQKLVDLALERGGGDNATAVVMRVLEAGETPRPVEQRRRDDAAIEQCPLWGGKVTPQQRLRALRVAIPRDHAIGERVPAHTLGDRVAWIIVEGSVVQDGRTVGPGALLYPESLVSEGPPPERDGLAVAKTEVRALALRADDFREVCDDDSELGEALLETIAVLLAGRRRPGRITKSGQLSERADTEVERPIAAMVVEAEIEAETERHATTSPDAADPDDDLEIELEPVVTPAPLIPPSPVVRPSPTLLQPPARPSPWPAGQRTSQPKLAAVPPADAGQRGSQPKLATVPAEPTPRSQPRTQPPRPPPQPTQPPQPAQGEAQPAQQAQANAQPAPVAEPVAAAAAAAAAAARPTLASATAYARAASPSRPPDTTRAVTPSPVGPAGLQHRPSGPSFPRPVTPAPRPLSTPGRGVPTEAEAEDTYYDYELEADPPPIAALGYDDDDDPIIEMTVSHDDDEGDSRITETITDTGELTLTLTITEPLGYVPSTDDEPTRIRAITAEDSLAVSGTIQSSSRRSKRLSEGWDE